MIDPKVVVLVFVSGKIVITGCKVRVVQGPPCAPSLPPPPHTHAPTHHGAQTRSVLVKAFENIFPVLVKYCKSDSTALTGPMVL